MIICDMIVQNKINTKKNKLGKIKIIISEKESGNNLHEMVTCIEKNGFVKEIEYKNVLGKQFLFAKLISGDMNADN